MRLLVVSHPAVVEANQEVYVRLAQQGWAVCLVLPSEWRHDYADAAAPSPVAPVLQADARLLPVVWSGSPLRHFYRVPLSRIVRHFKPDVAFVEQEPCSMAAAQWTLALARNGVPFGLQQDENLDRDLPLPGRWAQKVTLERAAFVAARSESAARRVREHHSSVPAPVVPHPVPEWLPPPRQPPPRFTIGFAGRFVPEKGLHDLLSAHAALDDTRLLLVGDGVMREELQARVGSGIEVRTGVAHDDMASTFAEMDVLVLPSRTTPTWAEQFGRVLVEALWCGTPVIGSDSGEIPWVIEQTGGGLVFPEGDVGALIHAIRRLKNAPEERQRLAADGHAAVRGRFMSTGVARLMDGLLMDAIAGAS